MHWIPRRVRALVEFLRSIKGIEVNLVGGAVVAYGRHLLFKEKLKVKDWDLEVYGVSLSKLKEILEEFNPKVCGKNFGILKLTIEGLEVDVSVPRRDNKVGVGHKGFVCEFDPNMSHKEAAMRRDFTINALFYSFKENKIIDYFGGMEDLKNGILRVTDPKTFVEDPLRMLRAMQLLARKLGLNPKVDLDTLRLIQSMVPLFPTLAKERIFEEWLKLLMSGRTAIGIEFLFNTGIIKWFPELEALRGCGQHPEWHQEGDVSIHSSLVSESCAEIIHLVDPEYRVALLFATLLHDVGKPATTVFPYMVEAGEFPKERLWTAWGHDLAGVEPARTFMERITDNKKLIERVLLIVELHMQPYNLFQGDAKENSWRKLHNKCGGRLDILGWMSKCDACGCFHKSIGDPDLNHEVSQTVWARFGDLGKEKIPKIVTGKDLIEAKFGQGKAIGVGVNAAYEAQIENSSLTKSDLFEIAKAAALAFTPHR